MAQDIARVQVLLYGGGGYGASAIATLSGGEVSAIEIEFPGRGYFNIDPTNTPSAQIAFTESLANNEKNATLEVRLGSLALTNSGKPNYPSSDNANKIGNKDPWIEIGILIEMKPKSIRMIAEHWRLPK